MLCAETSGCVSELVFWLAFSLRSALRFFLAYGILFFWVVCSENIFCTFSGNLIFFRVAFMKRHSGSKHVQFWFGGGDFARLCSSSAYFFMTLADENEDILFTNTRRPKTIQTTFRLKASSGREGKRTKLRLSLNLNLNLLYLRIPQQGRTLIEGVSIERLQENSCVGSDTIGYMCAYYLKVKKRQRRVVCESFLLW